MENVIGKFTVDDDAMAIYNLVEDINEAIDPYGLNIEVENAEHDGFEVVFLTKKTTNYTASKNKLRPCDCKDMNDVSKLDTAGIMHGNIGLSVEPNHVHLTVDSATVTISMKKFKILAEWYLEEQNSK